MFLAKICRNRKILENFGQKRRVFLALKKDKEYSSVYKSRRKGGSEITSYDGLSLCIDMLEFGGIEHLDATTIDSDDALLGETSQGADGVAGSHVGERCHVLSREEDVQGATIGLETILINKEDQATSQTTTDVLLGQLHGAEVGLAKVNSQVTDKVHCQVRVDMAETLNQDLFSIR